MPDPIQLAALVFLAAATAYVAVLIVNSVKASGRMAETLAQEREVLRARAAEILARSRQAQERSELSWNGFRKFEVADKRFEAEGGICSFYLKPRDRRSLPPFLPGQHVTVRLRLPDEKKPLIRCYSLSDCARAESYRITVKRALPPADRPDAPPGRASTFFHEQLKVGDSLDVKAPSGHFYLDTAKPTPIVLIGGGVGLTPLVSMLNTLAEAQSSREVWFFLGVKNSADHPMKDHLESLSRRHRNLHLFVCYSDPTPACVKGRDFDHAGHVTVGLMRCLLKSNNYDFYLCGPPPMMSALNEQLGAWGVPARRIHSEAFGPASVKRLKDPQDPAPDRPDIKVTFTKTDKSAPWDPQTGSLLDFAEGHGIAIDYGCRAGSCGTCRTAIQSGEVEYVAAPGEMPEQGSCLVCLSVPKSDLKLEA